jgi:HEAT repeats
MTRLSLVALLSVGSAASFGAVLPVLQQAPVPIQNGKVETRQASSIDREVTAAAASPDPVWVAWRAPLVPGDRNLCESSIYSNDVSTYYTRGSVIEPNTGPMSNSQPSFPKPATPVALEGGTSLVVLLRVVDKHVERVRAFGDDCPLDAGGRTVVWLNGVSAADSVKYLTGLLHQQYFNPNVDRETANRALRAIALHRDPSADVVLDQIATSDTDSDLRRSAASQLGANRGTHGFETLRKMIGTEKSQDVRRQLVSALGQTREPQTPDALLTLAQSDADSGIRGEAAYWYVRRAGARGLPTALAILDKDTDDNVKKRVVSGIAGLQADDSVPALIQLARTNSNMTVRKQAVSALGQTKDPRAVTFLEEILKR